MARPVFLLACALALLASSLASAAVVEHSLYVKNLTVSPLCQNQVVTAANGSLPGPTIRVREGDTLVVHVFNESPHNLTIHWHGIFQLLSGWADGAEYATQCPILPENNYTYQFNITGQEGTLWWHAHSKWLRATVYGALIIRPRRGNSYPFQKPYREFPILLGQWWNADVIEVEGEALASGGAANISDAYTINGRPGDLYSCSSSREWWNADVIEVKGEALASSGAANISDAYTINRRPRDLYSCSSSTYKLTVVQGKTYLLRIINAALNNELFFKIANHNMTVVAVDASYTTPMITDVVVITPGQTTDVLFTADQSPGAYYMAAHPYMSAEGVDFDNTTTTGIIVYENATSLTPQMPDLPAFNDTPTAHHFFSNLTGLVNGPHWEPVPTEISESMFVTSGLGLIACEDNATCLGPLGERLGASMNNESFVLPTNLSMLEAFFYDVDGIYTTDFPDQPPLEFDYTNSNNSLNTSIVMTTKSTKVKTLAFNSTVEMVLQNTALIGIENHPIHLHGFNFHVLAQGFGNYNSTSDIEKFNLINPQIRNTIGVPVGGWAVIRFRANNPGIWLMHCHLDVHLPLGLSMAFEIEDGTTTSTTLPSPPSDLPQC